MSSRSLLLAAALALLTMALTVGPTLATGPLIETTRDTISPDDVPCGDGVTFDLDLEVQTVTQLFADRLTRHSVVDGGAVASTGAQIRFHHSWSETIDFAAQTLTITGLAFGASVDDATVSRMDRGRLVIDLTSDTDLFAAGSWTPGPFDPTEATCDLILAAQT